jgi:hypothetical protein
VAHGVRGRWKAFGPIQITARINPSKPAAQMRLDAVAIAFDSLVVALWARPGAGWAEAR